MTYPGPEAKLSRGNCLLNAQLLPEISQDFCKVSLFFANVNKAQFIAIIITIIYLSSGGTSNIPQ